MTTSTQPRFGGVSFAREFLYLNLTGPFIVMVRHLGRRMTPPSPPVVLLGLTKAGGVFFATL